MNKIGAFFDFIGKNFLEKHIVGLFLPGLIFLVIALVSPGYVLWSEPIKVGDSFTIAVNTWTIMDIASIASIVVSIFVCRFYWKRMDEDINGKHKYGDNFYPTLMVAQGTFFTFIGISAVLLTYTEQQNANYLINGLKLAFLTSVIGLIFSSAAKIYIKKKTEKQYTNDRKENLYDDEQMYHALLDIKEADVDIKNAVEQQNETFRQTQQDYLEKSQEVLSAQTVTLIERVNQSILDNKETYIKAVEETNQKYIEEIEKISTQVQEQLAKYPESLERLCAELKTIGDKIVDEMVANNKTHINCMNEIKTNVRECAEDAAKAFEAVCNRAKESNESFESEMEERDKLLQQELAVREAVFKKELAKYEEMYRIKLHETAQGMLEETRGLKSNVANIAFGLGYVNNAIQDTHSAIHKTTSYIDSLNQSYEKNANSLADSLKHFGEGIDNNKISELVTSLSSFSEGTSEVIGNMTMSAQSLKAIVPILEETQKNLAKVKNETEFVNKGKEDIYCIAENLVNGLAAKGDEIADTIRNASTNAADAWHEFGVKYGDSLEKQFDEVFEEMNNKVVTIFDTAGQAFKEHVGDTNEKITKLSQEIRNSIDNTKTYDVQELIEVIGKLQMSVDKLQASIKTNESANEEDRVNWP